jgi:hypothetical protein
LKTKYSIYDKKYNEYIDLFYILLLDMAENTVLPEMYEIFGTDKVLKFLDIFAGATITVPSADMISKSLDKIFIFVKLYNNFNKETLDLIKNDYNLKTDEVLKIYNYVEERIREHPGMTKYAKRNRSKLK